MRYFVTSWSPVLTSWVSPVLAVDGAVYHLPLAPQRRPLQLALVPQLPQHHCQTVQQCVVTLSLVRMENAAVSTTVTAVTCLLYCALQERSTVTTCRPVWTCSDRTALDQGGAVQHKKQHQP